MFKLFVNTKRKLGHINPELQGISQSIWDAVFMKEFMWGKIPIYLIQMG